MLSIELSFLGRGSCFNVKEGNTSAYFKLKDTMVLFDCGENIFERIVNSNILDGIKYLNILITHCHSDHIGSLASLILYCHFLTEIEEIEIIQDESMRSVIKKYLDIQGVPSNYYNIEKDLFQYYKYHPCSIIIRPIKTQHNTECVIPSYSFIIEINEIQGTVTRRVDDKLIDNRQMTAKYIYYSGDTSLLHMDYIINDEFVKYYTDCTGLHIPGNPHLSLNFLNEMIAPKYRHKVYCMHLDSDNTIAKALEYGFNVVTVKS